MHCRNCGKSIDGKAAVCVHCGVPPKMEKNYCHNCGTATAANQSICVNCGVSLGISSGQKSKSTATLLSLLLGTVGGQKFYMGSWGWGIVYIVLCMTVFLMWIPIIAAFVETIRLILMTDEEFAKKAEAFKDKGPFGFFW